LPAEKDNLDAFKVFKQVLTGRVRSQWIDQYNDKFISSRRLIKDIRFNFALGYIQKYFPKVKIIYIMRHPLAVIKSRLRLEWEPFLDHLLQQEDLVHDFLADKNIDFDKYNADIEIEALGWSIENYVALTTLAHNQTFFSFYEKQIDTPEKVLNGLYKFIDITPPSQKRLETILHKPSELTDQNRLVKNNKVRIADWQKEYSKADIAKVMHILSIFGLDKIYDANLYPKDKGLKSFSRRH
jgi:hypothetical protein